MWWVEGPLDELGAQHTAGIQKRTALSSRRDGAGSMDADQWFLAM